MFSFPYGPSGVSGFDAARNGMRCPLGQLGANQQTAPSLSSPLCPSAGVGSLRFGSVNNPWEQVSEDLGSPQFDASCFANAPGFIAPPSRPESRASRTSGRTVQRGLGAVAPRGLTTPSDAGSVGGQPPRGASWKVQRDASVERDEHRVKQRDKQIMFGKVTEGYRNYTAVVPKEDRQTGNENHPVTPRVNQVCSKRAWDNQIGAWRRALHLWDLGPSAEEMRMECGALEERKKSARIAPAPERHHFSMPAPRETEEVPVETEKQPDQTELKTELKCIVVNETGEAQRCKMLQLSARPSFTELEKMVESKLRTSGILYFTDDTAEIEVDDSSSLQAFLRLVEEGEIAARLNVLPSQAPQGGSGARGAVSTPVRMVLRAWTTHGKSLGLGSATFQALRVLATRLPLEELERLLEGSAGSKYGRSDIRETQRNLPQQCQTQNSAYPSAPERSMAAALATPKRSTQLETSLISTSMSGMPDLVEATPSTCAPRHRIGMVLDQQQSPASEGPERIRAILGGLSAMDQTAVGGEARQLALDEEEEMQVSPSTGRHTSSRTTPEQREDTVNL